MWYVILLQLSVLSWLFSLNLFNRFILQLYYQVPKNLLCDYLCSYIYIYDCFKRGSLSFSLCNFSLIMVYLSFYSKTLLNILLYTLFNISHKYFLMSLLVLFYNFSYFRYCYLLHFDFSTLYFSKLLLWTYFLGTLLF